MKIGGEGGWGGGIQKRGTQGKKVMKTKKGVT